VLAVNGQPAVSSSKLTETVRGNGTTPLTLSIERDGAKQELKLTPTAVENETRPMIGVGWQDDLGITYNPRGRTSLVHPGPIEQIRAGVMSIFNTIGAIASRKSDVKLQHMGGPVMMMHVYYSFFQLDWADGWRMAFWFSVVLNVNLAMINMLPIPVLDGGHITLAVIEGIRRKPVNVRVLEALQTSCAVLIIGFMLYIAFFDVQDFFLGGGARKLKAAPAPEVQK
jgi:regulator of sigma E protease